MTLNKTFNCLLFLLGISLSGCSSLFNNQAVVTDPVPSKEIDDSLIIVDKNGRIIKDSEMSDEMRKAFYLLKNFKFSEISLEDYDFISAIDLINRRIDNEKVLSPVKIEIENELRKELEYNNTTVTMFVEDIPMLTAFIYLSRALCLNLYLKRNGSLSFYGTFCQEELENGGFVVSKGTSEGLLSQGKSIKLPFKALVTGLGYAKQVYASEKYLLSYWLRTVEYGCEMPTITGTDSCVVVKLFSKDFYEKNNLSPEDHNSAFFSFAIEDSDEFFPKDENPLGKEYDFVLEINQVENNIVNFNLKRKSNEQEKSK